MVGNGTGGEIVKGILGGAGVLGAADTLSGGGVRKSVKGVKNHFTDKRHEKAGHIKGDDGKWYDPGKESDRRDYFRNNPDRTNLNSYESAPVFKGATSPHTAATPHATPNNMTAQTSAVNMESSLNDFHNSSTSVLETQVLGADGRPARESLKTSSMSDSIAEVGAKMEHGGNKVTKTLGAAMVGLAGMSLFSSDAEAKTLNDIKPNAAASALTPVDTKGFSEIAGEIRRRGYFFLTCKRLIAQFY